MTQHIATHRTAMTALAVIAFASTPLLAQDAGAPDAPVAGTMVETPASADPLAPQLTASESPATEAAPPAPKPKVETARTATRKASAAPARSTARRASAAASAPAATPAAAEAAPAPPPAEPLPPVAEPAVPPAAEPVAASDTGTMDELMADNMLPIAGAAALGLAALGGTAIAMRRRRRRREDEEFAERQRLLDMAEADRPAPQPEAAAASGPAFARQPAPMHDPVPAEPARPNWESRREADFMFRRAGNRADAPVEPAK